MTGKKKPRIYRSAKTGRFVSHKFANLHPATTVSEKVKPTKKGKRC